MIAMGCGFMGMRSSAGKIIHSRNSTTYYVISKAYFELLLFTFTFYFYLFTILLFRYFIYKKNIEIPTSEAMRLSQYA